MSRPAVLDALSSRPEGLSSTEAAERLAAHGPNALERVAPVGAWKIFVDQLRSLVVMLLIVAACVAFWFGEAIEAAAILIVLVLNTAIGFFVELRARRAMEALLGLDVPRAIVIRDGEPGEIDARQLVPGDVILLSEGDEIPADVRLLEASELRVDEAPLTGESVPVTKDAGLVLESNEPLPARRNLGFRSTRVLAGSGRGAVVATGAESQIGRVGRLVAEIVDERTPLERRLDALGRRLVWITLGVAAVVTGHGLLQGNPLAAMIETGLALAVAAVPEGLPAVATIALAVGLRRMARRNALVRRLPAVEALGSTTVVCTDKTGTLTAGTMTVTRLWVDGADVEVSGSGYEPSGEFSHGGLILEPEPGGSLALALTIAVLASRGDVSEDEEGRWQPTGDPTEAALVVAARKAGLNRDGLLDRRPRVGEVPFSSERRLMASFHHGPDGVRAFVKGAPDTIVDHSSTWLLDGEERPLDEEARRIVRERNRALAADGLRVIALATSELDCPDPDALEGLTFVGLAGMIDPPAAGVRETIRRFRRAGIRTVMLTGDQAPTARSVALQLEMSDGGATIVDGGELAALPDDQLAGRIGSVAGFSRVGPEDKLRVVEAYQASGQIVAMLGDGVNDAAALKRADVGVAMGIRGTDIARETADIVLQDDRFPTLGVAVEEGRVIFDNIRKFVFYLFSCNAAEVMTVFVTGLVGLPLPLLPLQILWLNLVTDTFPALALALEPGEPDVMRRPPRDPRADILSARFLRAIGFYASLITLCTVVAFVVGLHRPGGSYPEALGFAFMTLAFAQLLHLGNARSSGDVLSARAAVRNPWALGSVVLVFGLQMLAMYWPPLAGVLDLEPLAPADWLIVAPLSALPAVTGQVIRWTRSGKGAAPAVS